MAAGRVHLLGYGSRLAAISSGLQHFMETAIGDTIVRTHFSPE